MATGLEANPAALFAIAASEVFPDMTHGAIPVIDRHDALETYLAFDDGGLSEVPNALAAYLRHQCFDCD